MAQTDSSGVVDAAREINSGKPLAGLSILIAEDDAINRMLLEVNIDDSALGVLLIHSAIAIHLPVTEFDFCDADQFAVQQRHVDQRSANLAVRQVRQTKLAARDL